MTNYRPYINGENRTADYCEKQYEGCSNYTLENYYNRQGKD